MKAVYIHKLNVKLNINGKWLEAEEISGRCHYRYGEVPDDYTERYDNVETVFEELIKRIGYVKGFKGEKTFWKKRVYLELFPLARGIVYKDSLKAVEISHTYKIIDNPKIEWLEKDLGFKGYSELIFDREQELKSMMVKG